MSFEQGHFGLRYVHVELLGNVWLTSFRVAPLSEAVPKPVHEKNLSPNITLDYRPPIITNLPCVLDALSVVSIATSTSPSRF